MIKHHFLHEFINLIDPNIVKVFRTTYSTYSYYIRFEWPPDILIDIDLTVILKYNRFLIIPLNCNKFIHVLWFE